MSAIQIHRRRLDLLKEIQLFLETPMFLLAVAWIAFLIKEFDRGLNSFEESLVSAIWIAFGVEFIVKFVIAPLKLRFLKKNWLVLLSLILPAFRVFRLLRVLRVGRAGSNLLRVTTSARRLWYASQTAQGIEPGKSMQVGVLLALGPGADETEHRSFAQRVSAQVEREMDPLTNLNWSFDHLDPMRLENDEPKLPSAFLDEATFRMAEGAYDIVIVITSSVLISRGKNVQPGLYSPVTRVVAISTRQLRVAGRHLPLLDLQSEQAVETGSSLLMHMIGHIAGLNHAAADGLMRAYNRNESLRRACAFTPKEQEELHAVAASLPDYEYHRRGWIGTLIFHFFMALRNPVAIFLSLWRSRSIFLSLSLPSLATAAVAPCFLLVFTAEIWDVGFGMSNQTAVIYAIASIIGATVYLTRVQSLFFPRREKRIMTEHLAVANVSIFMNILSGLSGLFLLIVTLVLVIEFWVFPEGLMSTWPTLEVEGISIEDQIRLAVFIATIGVTTGALAGGLESRTVIQHLALFEEEP